MRALEIVDYQFDEVGTPQKLVIVISNSGNTALKIESCQYTGVSLSADAISAKYARANTRLQIPVNRYVNPYSQIRVHLELAQNLTKQFVDSMRGRLGFLTLKVPYQGVQYEKLLRI